MCAPVSLSLYLTDTRNRRILCCQAKCCTAAHTRKIHTYLFGYRLSCPRQRLFITRLRPHHHPHIVRMLQSLPSWCNGIIASRRPLRTTQLTSGRLEQCPRHQRCVAQNKITILRAPWFHRGEAFRLDHAFRFYEHVVGIGGCECIFGLHTQF